MIADTTVYQHPEIETLDRADMLELQAAKLKRLGERLAHSEAWRKHFTKAGLTPQALGDPSAFRSIPTLEKADLRALYPFPFLTIPMENVARFCATSGTTGLPVMFGFSYADVNQLVPMQLSRILRCAGVAPGERVYQGYGYGLWVGGVAMDWGLLGHGCTNFGIGPGRAEAVVEWLRDHEYTSCTMSPLWLMTLTNIAKEKGIDPRRDWKLRVGVFGGQSVSAAFRAELEAAMPAGFIAHNIYGTTESGGPNLGISCPHSHAPDLMHLINEDTILTEILDTKTGAPVEPGQTGEIVITTLDKEASPVVRWRTRDLVKLAERPHDCPCGRRGLPLIGRIIGRTDDMLKVRGSMLFPSQIEDIIASFDATVNEAWQIYIDREDKHDLEELVVAVERKKQATLSHDDLRDALTRAITDRVGIRVSVECHAEGVLPRYEAKATRVLIRKKS